MPRSANGFDALAACEGVASLLGRDRYHKQAVIRRYLNEAARGTIAAKLANGQVGDNQHKRGPANWPVLPTVTQPAAAAMLHVSERPVQRSAE